MPVIEQYYRLYYNSIQGMQDKLVRNPQSEFQSCANSNEGKVILSFSHLVHSKDSTLHMQK